MSGKSGQTGRLGMGAKAILTFAGLAALAAVAFASSADDSRKPTQTAHDPGVRGCNPGCGAGTQITGLSQTQQETFTAGQTNFTSVFSVPAPLNSNSTTGGLGPVFNSNSCSTCHGWPAAGGMTAWDLPGGTTATNPLFSVYQADGATNTMPFFETAQGPELIARFPYNESAVPPTPDGSIHQLFTVTGRSDASGCNLAQPNFDQAQSQNNLVYREPIETFGDGLIEIIENGSIRSQASSECANQGTGICGTVSVDPHTGDVNRLGWKAQWRGLITASAEELNTELAARGKNWRDSEFS